MTSLKVNVLEEAGFESAMLGLSFNFDRNPENSHKVSKKLTNMDHGHNKFLRQMRIWAEVTAPRFWWQEADQYKVANTTQSQSTIHTILRNPLTEENFDEGCISPCCLKKLNNMIENKDFLQLKRTLPESFLQKRLWDFSYASLREMFIQRNNHKLPHWQDFLEQIVIQIKHPEYVGLI